MSLLFRTALLLAGLGLIYLAGAIGYWVTDRSLPTHSLSAFLLTENVQQGGKLQTRRTVDRERLCHTTIERMMFDERDRRYDLGTAIYPNGAGALGRETFIGVQTVPEKITPGPARYVALVCYRCNPMHWIWPVCEPARTQHFNVIPRNLLQ